MQEYWSLSSVEVTAGMVGEGLGGDVDWCFAWNEIDLLRVAIRLHMNYFDSMYTLLKCYSV